MNTEQQNFHRKFLTGSNEFTTQCKKVLEELLNKFSLKLIRKEMNLSEFQEVMRQNFQKILDKEEIVPSNPSISISSIDEIKILHKIRDYGGRTLSRLIEVEGSYCYAHKTIEPLVKMTYDILHRLLNDRSLVNNL